MAQYPATTLESLLLALLTALKRITLDDKDARLQGYTLEELFTNTLNMHPDPELAEGAKEEVRRLFYRFPGRREQRRKGTGAIPQSIRKIVLERDGYICHYCGKSLNPKGDIKERPTIDHKIPISFGGKDTIENLVVACHSCNTIKNNKTSSEFRPRCKFCEYRTVIRRNSYCKNLEAYEHINEEVYESQYWINHSSLNTERGVWLGWVTKDNRAPDWCPIWRKRIMMEQS